MPRRRALLFTVGTGDRDQVMSSLLTPLRKSIFAGAWDRLIAIPSQETAQNVVGLQQLLPDRTIEVRALPKAGMEEDVDRTFAHIDSVLEGVIAGGITPADIVMDYTRGTKPMSAAMVLAAVARGVRTVRYIGGRQRDTRGSAVSGQEVIRDGTPEIAIVRRKIDLGYRFIATGQFRAAAELFPASAVSPHNRRVAAEVDVVRWLAGFWGAWDGFDYTGALGVLSACPEGVPRRFAPTEGHRTMIEWLAYRTSDRRDRVDVARCRCADMLASARRRVAFGGLEDALIRCYRGLEMVGQVRLLAHGLDSENLDPSHAAVDGGLNEGWLRRGWDGRITAAREPVSRLLRELGDTLGERLRKFETDHPAVSISARNNSNLIHGLERQAESEAELVRAVDAVEEVFRAEDGGNEERAGAARFPWMA